MAKKDGTVKAKMKGETPIRHLRISDEVWRQVEELGDLWSPVSRLSGPKVIAEAVRRVHEAEIGVAGKNSRGTT